MRLEYQIVIAVLLELAFGAPHWRPHPSRLIDQLSVALGRKARGAIRDPRLAGSLTALAVIVGVALAAGTAIFLSGWIHPFLGDVTSILLLYTTLSTGDLTGRSRQVYRALARFDLAEARRVVSWLVGRDSKRMTETEVVRATVEGSAENIVTGLVAPLFFATVGGAVAAMAYKAAGTVASTIGFRHERDDLFGRTAAEIDDGANWLPSRIAIPVISAAAALAGQNASNAWRIARRDGRKHPNPQAGTAVAAFAGALGIRLGGILQQRGRPGGLPVIGDPLEPLSRLTIPAAIRLMIAATGVTAASFLATRWGIVKLLGM